ncbi:MAG: ArsR family transcriptional regulator [Rhodobacteraceae bacterium GWE1_64_9]|nr:MAG: ArsR family transcriptional regulator [Rhodobacteraceae bacterium GWE1_64_9]OHC49088.1 MAG: ArsR family transcriptional regulator [Rhodobacteraceae bacterium GWF1_65_7]HBD89181.1 ArsR family transcriptional regulator [Gemmobacter sp.]
MEINAATQAFAALGHPGRLSVFRMIMRMAPQGARPTEIAEALGMKQNTLSHYLSDLESAGLICSARQGRSLFYSADLGRMGALVGYLIADCCRGRPDLCSAFNMPALGRAMDQKTFNVLFICSGNSARSIFAEAILRDLGGAMFHAYSAGTRPNTELNPFALDVLARNGHDIGALRSKHLSEFQGEGAPVMDFVFTVCDTAAAEECPPWPGQPISGHWGLPDPVKAAGTDAEKALVFAQTYGALRRRIAAFTALPFAQLDRIALQRGVDAIALDLD